MENRHFAGIVQRKRGKSVRLKRALKLDVRKSKDGNITIATDRVIWTVDVKKVYPDERFEMVKWSILNAGFVFTERIEKQVRRALE